MTDEEERRPRAVGINHVALTVGDVEAAVEFYRSVFGFDLRGRLEGKAFLDMGDQFLALSEPDEDGADGARHLGLVVDDPDAVAGRLRGRDVEVLDEDGHDFRDPWGNRVQVVAYAEVQFTKADAVLEAMGLDLEKDESALEELREKGIEL